VLNVQVPFFFKDIVDAMNVPITEGSTVWILAGASVAGCESTYPFVLEFVESGGKLMGNRWAGESFDDLVRRIEKCHVREYQPERDPEGGEGDV
jgi:hypothetical protein